MAHEKVLIFSRMAVAAVCILVLVPAGAFLKAQGPAPEPAGPPPAQQALAPAQLEALVAPIALYPDALLSQILVASTYPLEIAEAAQWLQQNRNLQGSQLVDAAKQQNWDPSVQALVVFPDALNRLASDLRWTTDLGNAFLAQQADVMNAIQRLRVQAMSSGQLKSNPYESVTTENQNGQTAVEIQPANPDVMYVPQYNPEYVWGPPPSGYYYPDLYYPAFGFGYGFYPGIYIGSFFGGLAWGGWGWGPNWFSCGIFLHPHFFNSYGLHYGFGYGGRGGWWAHNPAHRWGVPYSNAVVANRYHGFTGSGYRGGTTFGRSVGPSNGTVRSFSGNQHAVTPGNAGGAWNRFGGTSPRPSYRPSTNASPAYRSGNSNLRGYNNGYHAAPAPNYRSATPSYGGSYRSTPSYGGSYRAAVPSYGGGSYRAPSYGGGSARPSNGGGSYHAPSSGGGGRSFGGGSFHSSGGGGSSHTSGGGGGFHGGGGGGGSHGGHR